MKYQFQSNPGEFSYKPALFTNVIKVLISVNFVIFILQTLSRSETLFFPLFGLVPKLVWSEKMVWQPVTYMFFHGGVWHVLINMFVLWMFGSELERFWGKTKFLRFYFITGIYLEGLSGLLFGLLFFSLTLLLIKFERKQRPLLTDTDISNEIGNEKNC